VLNNAGNQFSGENVDKYVKIRKIKDIILYYPNGSAIVD